MLERRGKFYKGAHMGHIDFLLVRKGISPSKKEDVLVVANRIAAIRYGDMHQNSPVEINKDDTVHIHPKTNNHWLYPPGPKALQPKGYWRLKGRYDTNEELELIVKALHLWL